MLLIVDKSKKNARATSNIAYLMGILSYAVTPYEILKEISPFYSAVLMINPDSYKEDREYFEKIRSNTLGVPIFAMHTEKEVHKTDIYFDDIFYERLCAYTLYKMIRYADKNSIRPIGKYCGFGIQASSDYIKPEFFEEEMPATRTETMILRLLLRTYPVPMSSAKILKYAFRPGKQIELASIRTHISLLNKSCRPIAEKNVVEFIPKEGYIISAPKPNEEYLKSVMAE